MMNGSIVDVFFGPLGKNYCNLFLWFSLFALIMVILIIITGIFLGLKKKENMAYYFHILMLTLVYIVMYYQNRILYTMCTRTL